MARRQKRIKRRRRKRGGLLPVTVLKSAPITTISNVAQILTDLIKKKPAPHVRPKYSPYALDVKRRRLEKFRERLKKDRAYRKSRGWKY